ncbi:hypothetical protein BO70DRAFT_364094 [Aspergillus heteromorphus CBS 117.55]|uniref:Uncharacterized protein n=1 Tax=Aspergillus heteromorphus CBS 117.55 TaxID=1448321 RepID=A0A317VN44_9EURO|nr:uncharacterized protein BO70DRAFT_364094 [Aspergillus heteromorphus CBS 117.55]PWY74999.1 hypothetical protein BO70DRAFT_364094 [Aspergillus heteromorphus CBS 117.55]
MPRGTHARLSWGNQIGSQEESAGEKTGAFNLSMHACMGGWWRRMATIPLHSTPYPQWDLSCLLKSENPNRQFHFQDDHPVLVLPAERSWPIAVRPLDRQFVWAMRVYPRTDSHWPRTGDMGPIQPPRPGQSQEDHALAGVAALRQPPAEDLP